MPDLLRIFVDILAPVFILVGLGVLAGKRLALDAGTLARLAYWIIGPAFIFDLLAGADLGAGLVARMLVAVALAMAGVGVVAWLVGRLAGRSQPVRGAIVLTSIYGNVGNFGLAIVAFTFGEEALPLAGLVLLPVNVVGLMVGVVAATRQRGGWGEAARSALTAPMVLAVPPAVAVNVLNLDLPPIVDRPVGLLAGALIPVMLVTLGVQLAGMGLPRLSGDVAIPLGVKLVVSPLVAAGAAAIAGLSGVPAGVLVLQAAMPAAVFTALVALEHDLEPDLVTTIVLAGTLASVITLPVVISLVG